MPEKRRVGLRAVSADESADPPASVLDAAESGDRRALLVALRTRVARALGDPKTHPRDISPLSRRLQEIAHEIELMDAGGEDDGIGQAASTPDEAWPAT